MRLYPDPVQFCDEMFRLKAYTVGKSEDVVSEWYRRQTGRAGAKRKATLDQRVLYLRQQPRDLWTRPYYDTLRDGVGEVRFSQNGVKYRAIGFFGPQRNDFTFLLFATKTDGFDPVNAIDIAAARRTAIGLAQATAKEITRWNYET